MNYLLTGLRRELSMCLKMHTNQFNNPLLTGYRLKVEGNSSDSLLPELPMSLCLYVMTY